LGIKNMLYVPYLKVNLLSVVAFEDEGYVVAFHNGQGLVYSREVAPNTTIVPSICKESLYRLLGRPIVWSNGSLDSTLYSTSNSMPDSTSASKAVRGRKL
jgi:hypothetical protein